MITIDARPGRTALTDPGMTPLERGQLMTDEQYLVH